MTGNVPCRRTFRSIAVRSGEHFTPLCPRAGPSRQAARDYERLSGASQGSDTLPESARCAGVGRLSGRRLWATSGTNTQSESPARGVSCPTPGTAHEGRACVARPADTGTRGMGALALPRLEREELLSCDADQDLVVVLAAAKDRPSYPPLDLKPSLSWVTWWSPGWSETIARFEQPPISTTVSA